MKRGRVSKEGFSLAGFVKLTMILTLVLTLIMLALPVALEQSSASSKEERDGALLSAPRQGAERR